MIEHEHLKSGDVCPCCGKEEAAGRVYEANPQVVVRLEGQAMIGGKRYEVSRLRCRFCGQYYRGELPADIKKQDKYSASSLSAIAINHYYLGLPFKRIELMQQNLGVPLADATQFDKMGILSAKIRPIYKALERLSAESVLSYYDDTLLKILTELKTVESVAGKGLHSTAIVSECGSHWIYLFYTNRLPGGAQMEMLLSERTSELPLTTMRDGSRQNDIKLVKKQDAEQEQELWVNENLTIKLVIAFCLVHGRRKFHELLNHCPIESGYVLECIGKVYKNEAHCKINKYTAEERLAYHKQYSEPIMSALHNWLTNQWQYHRTEHNSALGKAIKYMLKHWEALTRFLVVPGCPIDNNCCEQAIKVLIRYRKNSLFYQTLRGAKIGDEMMSVIHTAVQNNINVFEYLTALQENEEQVAQEPEQWLPWNYQETLAIKKSEATELVQAA